MTAIVQEKAVYATAATPGEAPAMSRRYTAHQSALPPSAKTPQKPMAPMTSAARGGSAKRGGASSSAAGLMSGAPAQTT